MDFFCLIALRDWFVNLNDRILREAAGEQAIDHYWPCNTRVSPATRRFVTSLGKCLQGECGTYNEPRPLASLVFFFPSRPHTYFVVSEKRLCRSADIDGILASVANQSTSQKN